MNSAFTVDSGSGLGAVVTGLMSHCAAEPSVKTTMRVVVVEDGRALERYLPEWEDLAENSIEPNVFYESWMLLPALDRLFRSKNSKFALVFADYPSPAGQFTRLCGFFPLERRSRYRGLPFRMLSLLSHEYCFLSTPLVRREHADLTLSAFLDWLEASGQCHLFQWRRIRGDGPFGRLLAAALAARGCLGFYDETFERAFFEVDPDADQYTPRSLSGRGRRELKRRRERLAEVGDLRYRELGVFDDIDSWVQDFLDLEASGWKGRKRTALACDRSSRAFLEESCHVAFERGKLFMSALTLGAKPIAMQCNFVSSRGCFAFKSAFDERYSRYSPGTLLLVDTVTRLSRIRGIDWMDSCTDPDNAMANRLSSSRRRIQTITMPVGRTDIKKIAASVLIRALPSMRRIKRLMSKLTPETRGESR